MYMSFNVVINSPDTIDDLTAANVNCKELRYNFDWNFMEDCEYDLTFSFRSTWNTLGVTTSPGLTQIRFPDLGAAMNVYQVGPNTTANTSNVIGNVTTTQKFYGQTGANHHGLVMFSAGAADNGPVRLKGKPQSSTFTVKLCEPDGALATTVPDKYSLVLHFKKIDHY